MLFHQANMRNINYGRNKPSQIIFTSFSNIYNPGKHIGAVLSPKYKEYIKQKKQKITPIDSHTAEFSYTVINRLNSYIKHRPILGK